MRGETRSSLRTSASFLPPREKRSSQRVRIRKVNTVRHNYRIKEAGRVYRFHRRQLDSPSLPDEHDLVRLPLAPPAHRNSHPTLWVKPPNDRLLSHPCR